jgi:hypothetical protein
MTHLKTKLYVYPVTSVYIIKKSAFVMKEISITYSKCVFVALGIQCAMRHMVTCGLFGSTTFFKLYLINGTIIEKKLKIKRVF